MFIELNARGLFTESDFFPRDLQVEEYADEVFDKLSKGAHIYFCGLKGMMPGIIKMLEKVAASKKMNWEETLKGLKSNGKGRLHFVVLRTVSVRQALRLCLLQMNVFVDGAQ